MGKKSKNARKLARSQDAHRHTNHQRASSKLSSKSHVRADIMLLDAGFALSISHAQALIMAGEMIVNEHRVDKAGTLLPREAHVRLRPRRKHQYVGRGGLKMQGILEDLQLTVTDWTCLDLGMSTGGFTDCLLQRGATHIFGVDVGKGLAHQKLVQDERVHIIENTHVKDLDKSMISVLSDLCVADISFNALHRLVTYALPFMKDTGHFILLVKPQFELSQQRLISVSHAGIVHDEHAQKEACTMVENYLESLGLQVWHTLPCRTKGSKGNQEYFIYAGMPHATNLAQIVE